MWAQISNLSLPLLLLSILVVSCLGSFHCVLMCAPLLKKNEHFAASLGRLFSYLTFGLLVSYSASIAWNFSAPVAVSLLIGIVLLGVFIKQKSFMHFHFPNSPYPFLKGVLLGALPCIWVSSFSVLLIGIANPFRGALLILVFWTGTLPGFWLQNWIQKQSWFSPKLQLPIQRVLIGLSLLFVIVRLASALPVGKNGTSNPLIHKEWFCLPGGSLILK